MVLINVTYGALLVNCDLVLRSVLSTLCNDNAPVVPIVVGPLDTITDELKLQLAEFSAKFSLSTKFSTKRHQGAALENEDMKMS